MPTAYLDITEANVYFANRLNSQIWDDATVTERNKALITASRQIDRLDFLGDISVLGQDLQFPRNNETAIPTGIKYATCELAITLLDDVDINKEIENISVTQHSFSNVKDQNDRSFVLDHIRAGIPSIQAWQYLLPYLSDPRKITLRRI